MDTFFGKSDPVPETKTQLKSRQSGRGKKLRVIPLGGCGEIGMNMTVFEYGDDMFIVDCGQTFPDDDLLGIDLVIPDFSYVMDNVRRLRCVILTHAHEDHVGALPYLLDRIQVPVYGTRLTCEMVREKLKEFELDEATDFNPVAPGEAVRIGGLDIEFIRVTHSIPEAVALGIRMPFGSVVFTGDYKIDQTPMDGKPFDFQSFARLGEEGVLALFADSTNIEREGYAGSEKSVIEPLNRLFEQAPRSIIFSCFASSLHRVQVALDLASIHRRKVFVTGLNMIRNLRIAASVGVINIPPDLVYDIREMKRATPEKRMILTTGSQAEPFSALSRMALDEHKEVKVKPGDTVIMSSRIIPGNEKAIYRMINHFFRRGAEVYYDKVANVHVSGHAHREEMRTMLALTRPKYLVPVHGEFRHLVEHKHLGVEMGIDPEKIFIMQNGDVLEFDADGAARGGRIEVSRTLVDGRDVGGVDEVVLRDRRHLSEDGMVIAMLAIDQASGDLVSGPDILSCGFLDAEEHTEFFKQCKAVVLAAFEECELESKEEWAVVKSSVRRALKKYIKEESGRFPVILPVVLEI